LRRRDERRAEQRRNDKSRDCKFGSHQGCLRRVTGSLQTSGTRFRSGARHTFRKFHFQRNSLAIVAQNRRHFPNISSPCEHRMCAKRFHWLMRLDTRQSSSKNLTGGNGNVCGADQGSSMRKMRRNNGIADHRT
jgi:hypothetical protein